MDINKSELLFALLGINIVIKWEHEIGDPKRKHKKKRIAKKWLKRYGTWQEYEGACRKGYIISFNGNLYVSRSMYMRLRNCINHPLKFTPLPHHGNNCTWK